MERIKTEVKMELMSEPVLTTTTSTASAEALSFLRNGDKRIESGEGFSCFKFCCRSIWIYLFSCPDPQKGGGGRGAAGMGWEEAVGDEVVRRIRLTSSSSSSG